MPVLFTKSSVRWPGVGALLCCCLTGCTPAPPEVVLYKNDFDSGQPVTGPTVLNMPLAVPTREQAHSGEWSAKIDAQHSNVMLGGTTWQALGQPRHLRINLWVWLYRPQSAAVLQVSMQRPSATPGAPGDRLDYQLLHTGETVRRYQRWEHTSLFVTVPGGMQPTDEVAVCIWGQGISGPDLFYFDDLTIENAD